MILFLLLHVVAVVYLLHVPETSYTSETKYFHPRLGSTSEIRIYIRDEDLLTSEPRGLYPRLGPALPYTYMRLCAKIGPLNVLEHHFDPIILPGPLLTWKHLHPSVSIGFSMS